MLKEVSYRQGDATAPIGAGPRIIAHVCNDAGGWGKGFVLALSKKWEEPEREYRRWHRERANNDFALGAMQLVAVGAELWVANMIAQRGVRRTRGGPPLRYEALDLCLERLCEAAQRLKASAHMPRIGAGLAGGDWRRIEALILKRLVLVGVETTVYDRLARST